MVLAAAASKAAWSLSLRGSILRAALLRRRSCAPGAPRAAPLESPRHSSAFPTLAMRATHCACKAHVGRMRQRDGWPCYCGMRRTAKAHLSARLLRSEWFARKLPLVDVLDEVLLVE